MRTITVGLLIASSFACYCVFGGELAYECAVLSEQQISDDGVLEPSLGIYEGKTFNVERSTGVVLGGGLGNSAYPTKNILDPGNLLMSYKLIWISKSVVVLPFIEMSSGPDDEYFADGLTEVYGGELPSHNVVYLEIKEWSDNFLKPFILVTSVTVLTGTCR